MTKTYGVTDSGDIPAGIERLLDAWRLAWLTLDKDLMLSLFDASSADFVYQAEEKVSPIRDAAALKEYWDAGADVALAGIPAWNITSQTVTILESAVVIFAVVDAEILVNGLKGTIVGDMHATIIVRQVGTEWKIFHYHEGRQVDPAAYVRNW